MPKPVKKDPARWHHEDLRRALLAEALATIEKEGVHAVNIRQLAVRTGVSPAAPYHHFPTREALLVALASEGFHLLGQAMREDAAGEKEPLGRLAALGRGYVRFALEHPGYFRVMFLGEVKRAETETLAREGAQAFALLEEAVVACQQARVAPQGNPGPLVLLAWSAVHGMASLWVDSSGKLDLPISRADAIRVVADTVAALFREARKASLSG
jgi:AcrR family transcriptional regulator